MTLHLDKEDIAMLIEHFLHLKVDDTSMMAYNHETGDFMQIDSISVNLDEQESVKG